MVSHVDKYLAVLLWGLICCAVVQAEAGQGAGAQTATSQPTVGADEAEKASRPQTLWTASRLTGDWGGTRTAWEDLGVRFDLYYNHFYGINTRGGADTENAQRNSGSVDLFLHLDFEKMELIPGGQLLLQAKGHFSRNVNPKVGALSDPFDDADDDKVIYIDQLYYQQAFLERKLQFRIGYLDQQTILDRNAYANSEDKQFMSTFLDNNNATIPLTIGLGASMFIDPTDWLGFVIGAADGDARLFRTGFDTAFHDGADFFGYFETDFKVKLPSPRGDLPGTYRFGLLYDPRAKEVFHTLPQDETDRGPDIERDDVGFYLNFDQMIYREQPEDTQGLGMFFRYGFRHGNVNRINHFWSLGGQYEGVIPGRDQDVLGFGMYSAHGSEDYRKAVNKEFIREVGYELYYKIQLAPWFTLTPDIQYIEDPGGNKSADDAVVVGFRARITF